MTAFVLDNSVTMRWCFEAGQHAQADAILALLLVPQAKAIVPVLWRYEVVAVLSRAETQGFLSNAKAAEFLLALEALPIEIEEGSAERIFLEAHRVAVAYRLTAYDAAYLDIAVRRNLPLATFDKELVRACSQAGVRVV